MFAAHVVKPQSRSILKTGTPIVVLTGSKSTSTFDYQFLERSKIPTMKFQKSLPRLPIPQLEKTIDRYLSGLQPIILDQKQYDNTVQIAHSFKDGEGKSLHQELLQVNKSNRDTSYISSDWFDMYLTCRDPLVLNFNPFISLKDDPDPRYMKLPVRITNFLISALRFKKSLESNVLSPELAHGNPKKTDTDLYKTIFSMTPESLASNVSMYFKVFPFDMSQYESVFNKTRIPQKERDILKKYPNSKHIVFLKGGQFFAVDVLDSNGNIRQPEELYSLVQSIINLNVDSNADSITTLSADDRDTWAEARNRLTSSSSQNLISLETLDSAIFVICIDDFVPQDKRDLSEASHNFLHGNISRQGDKPLNRWFDKSFSAVFDQSGTVCINFEHSWGDGVTILGTFEKVFRDSTKNHFVGPETKANDGFKSEVRHLPFLLSEESKEDVVHATKNWKDFTSSLDLKSVIYDKMSRDFLKKKKLSPDSMFQLAFQMAFYKVYKTTAPTYESCSTSAFKHGRTEVVRAATMETKRACEAFVNGKKSQEDLRKYLESCSKKHSLLAKEAAMGQGFDRHLFGLRMLSQKQGIKPAIFSDPSYSQASHYVLSTSCLFGNNFTGGAFGPVVKDGYGLAYGFVNDGLRLFCSSFKGQRDCEAMVDNFADSLDHIRNVLEKA
jgi:carnitine O-palmitoyltransferase 2